MPRYALIVENDAGRAGRYARLVEDAGAAAAIAGRSEEALAHVRRAGAPAMVLLDRVLPPDSGLELLRGLRDLLAGGEAPAVVVADSQAAYERAAGRSEELNIAEVLMRWHPLSEIDRAIRARLVPDGEQTPEPGEPGRGDPSPPDRPRPPLALPPHVAGDLRGDEPARAAARRDADGASRRQEHPDLAAALGVGAIVSGPDGRVKLANAAVTALFAVEAAKLRGMRREDVLSLLAERTGAVEEIARVARCTGPGSVTLALPRPRRRLRWEMRRVRCDGGQGTLDEIVDVTSEAERIAANDALVRIDAATGLHDGRGAVEALEREIAGAVRARTPLSVAVFEVTLEAADEAAAETVFRSVAWLLRDALRGYDLAARLGPRKLLAILPGARAPQAAATADRLRSKARGAVRGASISFGVSELDGEGDLERLLSAAEAALSASGSGGGGR